MDRNALRDRMASLPFAPLDSDTESRNAHALGYIAFYLGAIEQHLGAIAESLSKPRAAQVAGDPPVETTEAARAKLPGQKPAVPVAKPKELFHPTDPHERLEDAARRLAASGRTVTGRLS